MNIGFNRRRTTNNFSESPQPEKEKDSEERKIDE